MAPAKIPAPIIEKIRHAVLQAYADPAVLGKLAKASIFPETSSAAEFDAFIRSESARWSKVYKESGIEIEN